MTSILSNITFTGQTSTYANDCWPVDQEFPFTSITGYWKVNAERLECRTPLVGTSSIPTATVLQGPYLARTSICRLKSSIWTQAFHLPGKPNGGRRITVQVDITMPSPLPPTGYAIDDDMHVGLMYLGESTGKGFCWLFQNLNDGGTVRLTHAYVTGTTAVPTQFGPSVSIATWAAGSTHTMKAEVHLSVAGDIVDSTLFIDDVPQLTFAAVSAPLYNYLFGVQISSFASKNFYQGLVCRNFTDSGLATGGVPSVWSTYLNQYVIFQTNLNPLSLNYQTLFVGRYNVAFDKFIVRDINPATLLPPLDSEPDLAADFAGYTQISTAIENNTTSDTLTVAPSYSQPIDDQWEVNEFNSDAGYTTTFSSTTRRRRRWVLNWVAIPSSEKDTLVALTTSVQSRFRSFGWSDPDTLESLNVRFTTDMRVERVQYAVYNCSATVEEVLG